jgi:epsilon-lactone hydrolase
VPSLSATLVAFVLRTTGVYRRMYSGGPLFEKNLAKSRAARVAEPTAKMKAKLDVSASTFAGRTVWTLKPRDKEPTSYVLYWHGGGYVYPPTAAHWAFLGKMALKYGWHVTAPLYPLAPETRAEETTAFALALYRDYAKERGGGPFTMGGDSAGGGLAAATLQAAHAEGLALPARVILICPWLDADPSHPDQPAIERRDAILTLSGIREAGKLYAGDLPLTDPRVSPIHGNWRRLPDIMLFAGGDDILATDARRLKEKSPATDIIELEGMIHDWPLFSFPESRLAQSQMSVFSKVLCHK